MLQKMMDAQYRRPSGLLGRWVGRLMAQQHIPENEWTVNLLDAQPDHHILEIGFGPGLAIEHLTKQISSGHITGIDFSRAMVRAARKRNAKAVRAGLVELHYGDAQQLPFEDAVFDRVFSIHSIYFWPDALRVLREIHRVMKVGGILVLTILPAEKAENGTAQFKPYTGKELKMLLSQAGFIQSHSVKDELARSPSNFAVVARR